MKTVEFSELAADTGQRYRGPYTPFTESIEVSCSTLERLTALYKAGHLPDSAGLIAMSESLGWVDCAELDTVIALNIFVSIKLPDGRTMLGRDVIRGVDFANPHSSQFGNLVIPARQNAFDWWLG